MGVGVVHGAAVYADIFSSSCFSIVDIHAANSSVFVLPNDDKVVLIVAFYSVKLAIGTLDQSHG